MIAPPAVALKLPLLVNVMAGNAMAALSNCNVKLRKLLMPVKLGNAAPALVLRKPMSRIFVKVPPKTGAVVPKLLACVFNRISEVAVETAKVVAPPVAVMTPDCVIEPPAVNDKVLPTPTVPTFNAVLLVKLTALEPLLESETAPVKLLLPLLRVMAPAVPPAVKLAVPGTTNAPV